MASTFAAALETYNLRYQDALSSSSKREVERFSKNWNQINSYYDIINAALGEGDTNRAQDAYDSIIDILNSEGISVDSPTVYQASVAVSAVPGDIEIPTGPDLSTASYTNAFSDIIVYEYNVNSSDSWGFVIETETNVTAFITDNRVSITNLTASEGSVEVRCSKFGFSDVVLEIPVRADIQSSLSGGEIDQITGKASAEDFDVQWIEGVRVPTNVFWTDYDTNYGSSTGLHFGLASSRIYETSDNNLTISTSNLTTTGLVNGRDMVADGDKLDNIDSGTTVASTTNTIWLTGEADGVPTYYRA